MTDAPTPPDSGATPPPDAPPAVPRPLGDTPPMPYQEMTDLAFGEHAATTFEVEQPDRYTLVLRGSCPRCGHIMDFRITEQLVRRRTWLSFAANAPAPQATTTEETVTTTEETMMCTCGVDHPNRPADYVGCGAYWNVKITQP